MTRTGSLNVRIMSGISSHCAGGIVSHWGSAIKLPFFVVDKVSIHLNLTFVSAAALVFWPS